MGFRARVINEMKALRTIFEVHGIEKGIENLNTLIKTYMSESRHQPSLIEPQTALP